MIETISREQYKKAYKEAPEIVRAVYDADLTVQIIMGLQTKYKLHVDQAGLLGEGVGYMLLGLINPQEFLQELIATGISETDASQIMTEINQKIFVPLREDMQKAGGAVQQPQKVAPPPAQEVQQPAKIVPAPNPAPRVQQSVPQRAPTFEPRTTMIPANPSLPPREPQMMVSVPRYSGFQKRNTPSPAQQPQQRAGMPPQRITDSKHLLEDHEEPHIEFHSGQVASAPRVAPPTPPTRATVPPPNLPGQMPSQQSAPAAAPVPLTPKPQVSRPAVPPPAPQPYTTDPYREPIDDK